MPLVAAQLSWFSHSDPRKFPPVGIIRDHKGGALVIGGPTGSHYTGHGESWEKKETWILGLGYVESWIDTDDGAPPGGWRGPAVSQVDMDLVNKIRKGVL